MTPTSISCSCPQAAVAVVGMGCRFPGANNIAEFWAGLRDGRDAIGPMPPERFKGWERLHDPRPGTPGRFVSRQGGFIEALDQFDAGAFGLSPREAAFLDPQQRLLLEASWEALELAGWPFGTEPSRTGVYVGMWTSDYENSMNQATEAVELYMVTGAGRHSAAGRVSHVFNLRGPSFVIDSGCSSALVAVHQACQSLREGECDAALAGGVNVILQPPINIGFSRASMLSPDGRCKFGDAAANGYVRSDGCGMVALKLLDRALADGDPIIAVILGSGVGHDGQTGFFLTPSRPAQESLLREVCRSAGVEPAQVAYVEAHGTGTSAGDPVELGALGSVFGEGRKGPLFVGSVKTNIGHTEAAAGVAGLIKAALAVRERTIPASLHFKEPSPKIAWSELPVAIPTETRPWPTDAPAIAGVNSFGVAGTNAHVIVCEPRFVGVTSPVGETGGVEERAHILPLSAHSPEALKAMAATWRDWIREQAESSLVDLCYTAGVRRAHRESRVAVVGKSRAEIAERLDAFLQEDAQEDSRKPGGIAFVFSGQGPQWHAMGRLLMAHEPVFRDVIEQCDAWLLREAGWSLLEELAADESSSKLDRTDITQPALFALQVGLAKLWESWGVAPDAIVGHSSGEVAAACAAGALSLEDGLRVILHRGLLQQTTAGTGRMLVTDLSVAHAEKLLASVNDRVTVATVNSSRGVTLAGDPATITELHKLLEEAGRFVRLLRVDIASHSPHMEPLMAELSRAVESIAPQATSHALISTVTGAEIAGEELGPDYWARNIRQPVLFEKAMGALIDRGVTTFIEISPHPVLANAIAQDLADRGANGSVLPSLRRGEDEPVTIRETLARLYMEGRVIHWRALYPRGRVVELPGYPWQRERYWFEDVLSESDAPIQSDQKNGWLGRPLAPAGDAGTVYFESELSMRRMPILKDHRVEGTAVVAGAVIAELMLEAAGAAYGAGNHRIQNLRLIEAVSIPDEGSVALQWALEPDEPGSVRCRLSSKRSGEEWGACAEAEIELGWPDEKYDDAQCSGPGVSEGVGSASSGDEHYQRMRAMGLEYGPAFQGIAQLNVDEDHIFGVLKSEIGEEWRRVAGVPPEGGTKNGATAARLAPNLIDSGLQLLLTQNGDDKSAFVLESIGNLEFYAQAETGAVHARAAIHANGNMISGEVEWFDGDGRSLAIAREVRLARLERAHPEIGLERFYEVQWAEAAVPTAIQSAVGKWMILTDAGGIGTALAAALRDQGGECLCLQPGADLEAATADASSSLRGVVLLWALDSIEADFDEPQRRGCGAALEVIQTVVGENLQARLWFVTRGAQPVGSEHCEPSQAPMWGLARSLATEHPELRPRLVDLDPAENADSIAALVSELGDEADTFQAAWRGGKRFVARLAEMTPVEAVPVLKRPVQRPCRLELTQPGSIENLALTPLRRRAPGPGEVEIRVRASALNFRDVWVALGMIADPTGLMGLECAGEIARVGEGVNELSVGDSVIAIAQGAFASFVTVSAEFVAKIDKQIPPESATANAVAYLTAGHGLINLAKLNQGETVLVHAASGGVGLAAVALARMIGARVIATAGRASKRRYLRSIGIEHVFNSRSVDFAEKVREATGGRGVDVVLNSLAGDFIPASFAALAKGGRFVEIGKTGIWSAEQVGAARPDCAYYPFDLLEVMRGDPELIGRMLRELVARIENGQLAPLPYRSYPIEGAIYALRHMTEARHIGKIVLTQRGTAGKAWLDPDGAYLITGGLGALGLVTAQWLAARGARKIALTGRREPSAEALQKIGELEREGVRVLTIAADISRPDEAARVIERVETELGVLRGIVHAAGTLADGVLANQNWANFELVFAPKILGAWNLHQLTLERELDFFIMYSSTASLLGPAGQANHAAANAFMDALAHERRGRGLPAMSVNWGPWAQIGAAADPDRLAKMEAGGQFGIDPRRGIDALDRLLDWNPAQACVGRFGIERLGERYGALAKSGYFEPLKKSQAAAAESTQPQASVMQILCEAATNSDRLQIMEGHLRRNVAQVLRLAESRVDTRRPLKALGLDSLTGLELRNRLENSLGLKLPASLVWNYPTIDELGPHLIELMGLTEEKAETAEASEAGDLESLLNEVESMSDDEARRQLVEEK